MLGAVFLTLTLGAGVARAAGKASATSALQIGVQVVRSCTVDTMSAGSPRRLDTAGREALILAAQASLTASCGATQTRIELSEVRVSLLEPVGTVPRLDVEF